MKEEHDQLQQKLELAARAMKARQHKRATELFPEKNPTETDFYKAHVETIEKWIAEKLKPSLDNGHAYMQITRDIEGQLDKMMEALVASAQEPLGDSEDGVDQSLLAELDSFVQEQRQVKKASWVFKSQYSSGSCQLKIVPIYNRYLKHVSLIGRVLTSWIPYIVGGFNSKCPVRMPSLQLHRILTA